MGASLVWEILPDSVVPVAGVLYTHRHQPSKPTKSVGWNIQADELHRLIPTLAARRVWLIHRLRAGLDDRFNRLVSLAWAHLRASFTNVLGLLCARYGLRPPVCSMVVFPRVT